MKCGATQFHCNNKDCSVYKVMYRCTKQVKYEVTHFQSNNQCVIVQSHVQVVIAVRVCVYRAG